MTTIFGSSHASATSSTLIWDTPSSPIEIPPWLTTIFTLFSAYATPSRSWSNPLHMRKHAKLEANGIFPVVARPEATPTRFASAIPTLKNLSGYAFAKSFVMVDFERSASSTTTLGWSLPISTRAFPYACRVAIPNGRAMLYLLFPD